MAKNKEDQPEDVRITDDTPDGEPISMNEPDTVSEEKSEPSNMPDAKTEASKTPDEAAKAEPQSGKQSPWKRLTQWMKAHKVWTTVIIAAVVVVITAIIVALTDARFAVMNVFMKASADITVLDEKTHQPVPNARVTIDNVSGQTDTKGVVNLRNVQFGPQSAKIEKDAYATLQTTVRIEGSPQKASFNLHPTGTPLAFIVTNKINGTPVKGAKITFESSDALSDDKGKATLHVPPQTTAEIEVKLSADGYNSTTAKIKIDEKANNAVTLTPAGKLYFLSKRTGKINVMSSNLDGTEAAVIVAGTGKESDLSTTLLASRDWKFLALKASRDSDKEKVYLIDTSNNQLTTIDEGDAAFSSIGWHDHDFVFTVDRNTIQSWQANKTALKSYNADSKSLRMLDQTASEGSQSNYSQQLLSDFYIVKAGLVYTRTWYTYNTPAKAPDIAFATTDGKQKKALKTFDTTINGLQARIYEPEAIYFAAYGSGGVTNYYEFEDGAIKSVQLSDNDFNGKFYPTYLISPSGNATYWYEPRDGKNVLQVGDANGKNAKEVVPSSDYVAYGWYSDDYLLASKKSSELYIIPRSGLTDPAKALKITDYHKPQINFSGYGYGYGGF